MNATTQPAGTPLRAVLLDVGGTLLGEARPRAAIYADAARSRGIDVDDARMLALMRRAHRALPVVLDGAYRYSDRWFQAFIGKIFADELGLDRARLADATEELFARFEDADTFRVFPGCVELLDACRARGLALGVVSNWSARLPRVLAATGLAERLDFVVCSALERCEKPDRAIFELALERAGVPASAALHAGDHVRNDGYGAREAGIEPVLVEHGGRQAASVPPDAVGNAPDAAGAFRRVGGLSELARLILSRLP